MVGGFADPDDGNVGQLARGVKTRISEAADQVGVVVPVRLNHGDDFRGGDNAFDRALDRTRATRRRQGDDFGFAPEHLGRNRSHLLGMARVGVRIQEREPKPSHGDRLSDALSATPSA